MSDIDLQQLKNDKEFVQNLERLSNEAKEQKSVLKAYQVLDASLLIEQESETIDSLFSEILQLSFDDLAQKLADNEKFNPDNEEDLARLRAIYEHGIEKYSNGDFKGAKEIFLILHYMFENEQRLKKALQVHIIACMKEVDFDAFFEKYTDAKAISEDVTQFAHFITHFSINTDEFINQNQDYLKQALSELDSLKG